MYLIAKENKIVKSVYGTHLKLDMSNVWQVMRTPACVSGQYALFRKDADANKFSIFKGYITYENICDWFEMIKWTK